MVSTKVVHPEEYWNYISHQQMLFDEIEHSPAIDYCVTQLELVSSRKRCSVACYKVNKNIKIISMFRL